MVSLRLGFRMLVGFSERDAEAITRARGERPFASVADVTRRTKRPRAVVSRLARADAFGSLEQGDAKLNRRQAIWEALAQEKQAKAMPLFDGLDELGATAAEDLFNIANNRRVKVAGIVLLRQRPSTAKGITFVTIEDETGTANLVVHQKTWEKFYTIARRATGFFVHGRLERKDRVIHVIVERLEDLSARLRQLAELSAKSRDFR